MVRAVAVKPLPENLAEMLHRLGDVPPERIRWQPYPGTATEEDVIFLLEASNKRLCELVDGVLVEKTMGVAESVLTCFLVHQMFSFVDDDDLGLVLGPDGPFRLFAGRIRMPDVSFISWGQLPGGELPNDPIADLAPRLAAEVLSKSNTRGEIERKLDDYFKAGVELVWIIDPVKQIVDVYSSRKKCKRLTLDDALDGGRILAGFHLPLKKLFARRARKSKS